MSVWAYERHIGLVFFFKKACICWLQMSGIFVILTCHRNIHHLHNHKFTMAFCKCGRTAALRTSWTEANPESQFYTCHSLRSKCNFFVWVDPPMCRRACVVIKELMDTEAVLKNEVSFLREEVRIYKLQEAEFEEFHSSVVRKRERWLIINWIFFMLFVLLFFIVSM
ncbi:putative transcription factor GRF family [Helianthus annuus]|nr:putative transcription factor GRF family [Helianthus annuus]